MIGVLTTLLAISLVGLIGAAITRNCVFEMRDTAPAGGVTCGTIKQYNGQAWVSEGLRTIDEGEQVTWRRDVVVEVPKDAATTVFADSATVGWDDTNQEAVTGGTGDYDIGKARGGSANGDATVLVALNE